MPNGPTDESRAMILGRTGSGKTWFGMHLLSQMNIDEIPYVMIDYKGDALLRTIVKQNRVQKLRPTSRPPTKPGLYHMQPRPHLDDDDMEQFLMACWKQQDIGLYVDEGYALPQRAAFDMILTQGRSRHIPVIALYQRPVWMSRFAIAQADFFAAFEQNDTRDLLTTNRFIKPYVSPDGRSKVDAYTPLPKYHCLWYDVSEGKTDILTPVPGRNTILANYRTKLGNGPRENQPSTNGAYAIL